MARHIETTRRETLDAAVAILHRSNTARGLSMDALAAELGTSKSSAYRWFDDRGTLVYTVVDEADTSNARAFADDVPGALFERGPLLGKRDQIPPAARERLDLLVVDLVVNVEASVVSAGVPSTLVPAVTNAIVAAVTTAPSRLSTSRAVALDSALNLLYTLIAN